MQKTCLEVQLSALPDLSGSELRQRWVSVTGKPVPQVSLALMRLALAWELQAKVHGGLAARTERLLLGAGVQETVTTLPKQKLVREWKGVAHTVTVEADDTIRWNGKTWRSLSEVARAITGTRWSGPAFFGLKQKRKAA